MIIEEKGICKGCKHVIIYKFNDIYDGMTTPKAGEINPHIVTEVRCGLLGWEQIDVIMLKCTRFEKTKRI